MHSLHRHFLRRLMLAGAVTLTAAPAVAADVTPQRLTNPEPGNWLMNHRTYDAQRYSPLDAINKGNVKGLKLAYAVAIGGNAVNENLESTPLAEDGYLYVVDLWGVVYKIDGRSGDVGRIVWRMDPGQEKAPADCRAGSAVQAARTVQRAQSAQAHQSARQNQAAQFRMPAPAAKLCRAPFRVARMRRARILAKRPAPSCFPFQAIQPVQAFAPSALSCLMIRAPLPQNPLQARLPPGFPAHALHFEQPDPLRPSLGYPALSPQYRPSSPPYSPAARAAYRTQGSARPQRRQRAG